MSPQLRYWLTVVRRMWRQYVGGLLLLSWAGAMMQLSYDNPFNWLLWLRGTAVWAFFLAALIVVVCRPRE